MYIYVYIYMYIYAYRRRHTSRDLWWNVYCWWRFDSFCYHSQSNSRLVCLLLLIHLEVGYFEVYIYIYISEFRILSRWIYGFQTVCCEDAMDLHHSLIACWWCPIKGETGKYLPGNTQSHDQTYTCLQSNPLNEEDAKFQPTGKKHIQKDVQLRFSS